MRDVKFRKNSKMLMEERRKFTNKSGAFIFDNTVTRQRCWAIMRDVRRLSWKTVIRLIEEKEKLKFLR